MSPAPSKRDYILGAIVLLLLSSMASVAFYYRRALSDQLTRNNLLEEQLSQAEQTQKEAVISRRISSQMEEIAYQQKDISDIQRQEAEHQSAIAKTMRERAEQEKERAVTAQQTAIEARDQMQQQKKIADQRREEAIAARLKADTLAKLALARSLGAQSTTQYNTGSRDLAALLSYAAWKFTADNHGDQYQPAIFDALTLNSNTTHRWSAHKGAVKVLTKPNDNANALMFSADECGELVMWKIVGNGIERVKTLFGDNACDLRDIVTIDTGDGESVIALSYDATGIVVGNDKLAHKVAIPIKEPIGMVSRDGKIYIASKNGQIVSSDSKLSSFDLLYNHKRSITTFSNTADGVMLGDSQGEIYRIDTQGKASLMYSNAKEPITYIYSALSQGHQAVGYRNGTIVYGLWTKSHTGSAIGSTGMTVLTGHLSRVTRIAFANGRMLSASYDGTVRMWETGNHNKISSSVVFQGGSWIETLIAVQQGTHIIIGDQRGDISMVSIDAAEMAEVIRKNLTRDFTQDEWKYYIGELSKYERFR